MTNNEKDIFKLLDNIAKDDIYNKSLKEELSTIPLGLTRKTNVEYLETTESKGRKVAQATIQYFSDTQELHREDGPAKIVYDKNENISEMLFYNEGKRRNTYSIKVDENGAVKEKIMRKNNKWIVIAYENGEPLKEESHTMKRQGAKIK